MSELNGDHASQFEEGMLVRIVTPGNVRLNGQQARVDAVTEWGAHLTTGVGSGMFRALFSEMIPWVDQKREKRSKTTKKTPKRPASKAVAVKEQGYTGDVCERCGSMRMKRSGACLTCEDCGENSGCG